MILQDRYSQGQTDQRPEWFVPGGTIPPEILSDEAFPADQFPDGVIPLDYPMHNLAINDYFFTLGFKLACQKAVKNTGDEVLTFDEYRLFHRFLVLENIWTEDDFQKAEDVMHNLPEVKASGTAAEGSFVCTSM